MNAQNKSRERKSRTALIATSSPPSEEKIKAGLAVLMAEAPWISLEHGWRAAMRPPSLPYLAADDEKQAENFSSLFCSHDLDLLWAMRGGYGILRWIEQVELKKEALPSPPPLLIGFSDVTVLHAYLMKLGLRGLHAPLLTTLPATAKKDREALWGVLGEGVLPVLEGDPLIPGRAQGTLVGGNLACLISTISTPLEPDWKDKILFFEDINEPLYKIDRMLTQLLSAGKLQRLRGIAVGELLNCQAGPDVLKNLLYDRLGELDIPVVWNVPAGHGDRNVPLLLGARYEIDGDEGLLIPMEVL